MIEPTRGTLLPIFPGFLFDRLTDSDFFDRSKGLLCTLQSRFQPPPLHNHPTTVSAYLFVYLIVDAVAYGATLPVCSNTLAI
jgi:hypothetical protein